MNSLLDAAIRQAYAMAPATVRHIHSLELRHEGISEPVYIVQGYKNVELTIPNQGVKTFLAAPFRFSLPKVSDGGLQELNLTFDNVDRRIGDFCRMAVRLAAPVEVYYRPYLSTDLTTPRFDPALLLFLLNVSITLTEVSGRAVPRDFINRNFPNVKYDTRRFPGLLNI